MITITSAQYDNASYTGAVTFQVEEDPINALRRLMSLLLPGVTFSRIAKDHLVCERRYDYTTAYADFVGHEDEMDLLFKMADRYVWLVVRGFSYPNIRAALHAIDIEPTDPVLERNAVQVFDAIKNYLETGEEFEQALERSARPAE